MLTPEEIQDALAVGHEVRGFEFKGPGSPDDRPFLAKIARAALSMGNLRDGGIVIIGIDDGAPEAMLPGLDDEQLEAWLDFDTISARLAVYADPPLRFDISQATLRTDARVVVIEVEEFADVPHLCARGFEQTLREGALYVRTRRLPETAEVPTATEMREVLDLAAEKRLRAYVESAERAGIRLSTGETETRPEAERSEERFRTQAGQAWDE